MIDSDILSVNASRKTMSVEESSLGHLPYTRAIVGAETLPAIEVKSARTGRVATFVRALENRNPDDGELASWDFVPTQHTLNRQPQLAGWTLRVYND